MADEVGLDLRDIAPTLLGVGGTVVEARDIMIGLRLEEFEWEASVSFCAPWPFAYQLLGLEGFFRWFDVTIRAADLVLDIEPIGQ